MTRPDRLTRRASLKRLAAFGSIPWMAPVASTATASSDGPLDQTQSDDWHTALATRISEEPFVDTHEHLIEEEGRLRGHEDPRVPCDDWALLFSHYLDHDLVTSGMPGGEIERFFSPDVDPGEKWRILAPYWPAVRQTGYGQAVEIAMRQLYGVDELSAGTVDAVQTGYEALRKAGFYGTVLRDVAGIESCQVNSLEDVPFMESSQPTLLMQDLSIVGMFGWLDVEGLAGPAGVTVQSLSDWYRVMDWWFDRYGPYAVAVKSQHAYARDIDYERATEDQARGPFAKRLRGEDLDPGEQKALEDHLFWEAVDRASARGLPIKLHTGYYAGHDRMPLSRLMANPGSASRLCELGPDATFVFMHIGYPFYEPLIALAKQYTNAYLDMCWAWIVNPVAAADFLKKALVTVPANKILTFGGDYIPVEPVVGHAAMARNGIRLALAGLVREGWLSQTRALELVPDLMNGNARRIFGLDAKKALLEKAPW